MSVVVVTPSDPLVSAADARIWAPVLRADDDGRITALLAVAQATLDPPSWLGTSLGEQVLEYRAPAWPWVRSQTLPYGPVSEIVSVTYDDPDGVEQTLAPEVYGLVDENTTSARIALKTGQPWPSARCGEAAVRVRYKAGRPIDDPRLLPAKHAIVLSAVQLRSLSTADLSLRSVAVDGVISRTWTVSDAAEKLVHGAVKNLLSQYRVWSV